MDLCSLESVKRLVGKTKDDDDLLLVQIIRDVSSEVETYLDRTITIPTSDIVEIHDIRKGEFKFYVSAYPITSVTDVRNDYDRTFAAATVITDTNYDVKNANGVITIDREILSLGTGVLQINYKGGMAANSSDFQSSFRDIVSACTVECSYRFQRRNHVGLIAATVGGGSVTLLQKTQFLATTIEVLDRHLRI
jgi:hypothetical protein